MLIGKISILLIFLLGEINPRQNISHPAKNFLFLHDKDLPDKGNKLLRSPQIDEEGNE